MFGNVYKNKTVLVTGNTGFKGSWLTLWLEKLGAKVIGYSNQIPTTPSIFAEAGLESRIKHFYGDICDYDKVYDVLVTEKPDFVFHLAAQPIVSISYDDPLTTIRSNVLGTATVMEALRVLNRECTLVSITSDKCYENVEWEWGYRETDRVGGKDIYSGSKGAAEVIAHSFYSSFFSTEKSNVKMVTARAGNVIGGGDWAQDRIVVDCVRAWSLGETVEIRRPNATRPWQHVLEPLSGYLALGAKLYADSSLSGQSFNFGPRPEQSHTVGKLIDDLSNVWGFKDAKDAFLITQNVSFHEAGLLQLNCDKAIHHLGWLPTLDYMECVSMVGNWYRDFYQRESTAFELTVRHIDQYEEFALKRNLAWTK